MAWHRLFRAAYLPYMMVVYPCSLAGVDLRRFVASTFASVGLLIFVLGVLAWFYTRFQNLTAV